MGISIVPHPWKPRADQRLAKTELVECSAGCFKPTARGSEPPGCHLAQPVQKSKRLSSAYPLSPKVETCRLQAEGVRGRNLSRQTTRPNSPDHFPRGFHSRGSLAGFLGNLVRVSFVRNRGQ